MARKTTTTTSTSTKPAATTPETLDLHALLLDGLKAEGITVKPKWSPSKSYASYYVDGVNIGYVFKQTRAGIRIEPAASLADLPKSVKGFKTGTRSERFALVVNVADEAGIGHAVTALKIAADKAAAEAEAKKRVPTKKQAPR